MAAAIRKEGGAVGRYDVARRIFQQEERRLLNRVAAGSPRGFQELDALRRSALYFPPSRFEGAVDYVKRRTPLSILAYPLTKILPETSEGCRVGQRS